MEKQQMRKHMEERLGKVTNYSIAPPLPKCLNIELNNTCNQKCIFCPFHGKYAPTKITLSTIDFETVKMLLQEAKQLGIGEKEVGFYLAGEAFLYPKLAEVIAYAKGLGFKYIFLTTNAALATEDKMKAVLDAGLDSIRISINAIDRETYKDIHGKDDFNQVIENLMYMHKYISDNELNVATSISCVITKKTLGIQKRFKEMFGRYVDDILFIPVVLTRLKHDKKFIEEYQIIDDTEVTIDHKFICPMVFDSMYINSNLEVVPCCEAYDTNCVFYDLKEDMNLRNAWKSVYYQKYRRIFLYNEDDSETICRNCVMRIKGIERISLE